MGIPTPPINESPSDPTLLPLLVLFGIALIFILISRKVIKRLHFS